MCKSVVTEHPSLQFVTSSNKYREIILKTLTLLQWAMLSGHGAVVGPFDEIHS